MSSSFFPDELGKHTRRQLADAKPAENVDNLSLGVMRMQTHVLECVGPLTGEWLIVADERCAPPDSAVECIYGGHGRRWGTKVVVASFFDVRKTGRAAGRFARITQH